MRFLSHSACWAWLADDYSGLGWFVFSWLHKWRVCYEINFSDRYRESTCVLFKLWQAITLRNKSAWVTSAGCQTTDSYWPCALHTMSSHQCTSPLWPCWDGGWAWVAQCLSSEGQRGLASRATCRQAGHYKCTVQSSHRHKTCPVVMTVAAHHPCIQTLHAVAHWTAMKTGPSADCGLSYQPLLPWSPQKNTNTNLHEWLPVYTAPSLNISNTLHILAHSA